MRILGVDYGTKRIGLALSDKTGKFAFPYSVIKFTLPQDVNLEIRKICEENNVKKIVLGKPEGYKGDAGKILGQIEKFKKEMEKSIGLPVIYENEVLTTQQAKRPFSATKPRGKTSNYRGETLPAACLSGRQGRQGSIVRKDASAAAIILQSYLDRTVS
ncbi:MAG: Holliday junction resolvase RuvX [Candidatus Tagabacteria bacterium CG09_land_8_20_14_0_10_41_14]|uniref:Putative pre-16S rRNA nuclease n=2 Tax=Candidatus Tagaibacteriota TaxID=1817918 RepID=A0A2H0WLD3_9BACT|nr:MAG: Holliday junction resolvase RuvX [Candidatus Tagabacteria bacterium CG09_land_8_20_14_0_10_41_14]PJE73123.1 MAG: Holliday junction resolvase RuvX [Candidatus Tagabacteria bacterium CG10_big_fil_rev_8_21_14_0_10_40_13]